MDLLKEIPCCYVLVAILWSIFQGIRGAIEHSYHNSKPNDCFDNWVILYIHDFVFRFVCTFAGFCSLYLSYFMLKEIPVLSSISTGRFLSIASSFIVGVTGVGGQLHFIISTW